MAKRKSRNPIGFTPWPVTFFTTAIFAALFASLVTVHNRVPAAPRNATPVAGINITEAWLDLQYLTNGYHPYNSKRNDQVRNWLLEKIETILKRNRIQNFSESAADKNTSATLFNDIQSNLTFSSPDAALSVAFTGNNIMLYIRGSEDPSGKFWEQSLQANPPSRPIKGGVLLNAHFDSVPSGYGATDDGVGVITVLQLISYFTSPGRQPYRGIVALLNNGEEDYLNGAYAFTQHPLSMFPHTFLNLEGAGAGGRAVLFRSTDTQVTKYYKKAPNPFGTVVSADGFKRGLVRSSTDYSVFHGELGMRGLDVAFMEPRAKYHTQEDSTRFTSRDSLWHMLCGALATMQGLTSDRTSQFDGESTERGRVSSGTGSESVWFDLYGQIFAVFDLHSLFAISVTLLVVTPLLLTGLTVWLVYLDKWYPFTPSKSVSESDEKVPIDGLRGFFRTPIVYVLSTAATVGLAFLLAKINPYIVYSSEYSVWGMMLSAWFAVYWFLTRGAHSMRPSALTRFYTLLWMYIGGWIILVATTVSENNFHLAGGYFLVVYFAAVFVSLFISYLELFALPAKSSYAELISSFETSTQHSSSRPATAGNDLDDDDATERTSLLRGDRHRSLGTGYGSRSRPQHDDHENETEEQVYNKIPRPYGYEQAWSGRLPSSTWILQFLILAPLPVVLIGQVALLMTSALYQTPSDGSPVLTIYLLFAALTVLLLSPITPFIHRFRLGLPTILFVVFLATLAYNLLAFPFSDQARLKVYFVQSVNLDTGMNNVSLTGLAPFVQDIVKSIPSAAGQEPVCTKPDYSARAGLTKCSWTGLPPNVLETRKPIPPEYNYSKLVNFTVTRPAVSVNADLTTASIRVSGINTKACRVFFNQPIEDFSVKGYATDPRFPLVGKKGCKSIRLWAREWGGSWDIDVTWRGAPGLDGRVVCLWSDANDPATIPAYHEVMRYMPRWSIATKLSDGLVEGYKVFKL